LKDLGSLIVLTGLRKTKADVRRLIQQGGVSVNGNLLADEEAIRKHMSESDLMHGKYIVIRVGKKQHALIELI
jgi:tyrosyl-tRNA synthetase